MLHIKYTNNGNAYFNTNMLSQNELLLLYTCYLDNSIVLVTDDNYSFNTANYILGKDRVMNLKMLVESAI